MSRSQALSKAIFAIVPFKTVKSGNDCVHMIRTLSFAQESVQKFLEFDTYMPTINQNLLNSTAIATPSKLEHQKL